MSQRIPLRVENRGAGCSELRLAAQKIGANFLLASGAGFSLPCNSGRTITSCYHEAENRAIYTVMQPSTQAHPTSRNSPPFAQDRDAPIVVRCASVQAEDKALNDYRLALADSVYGRRTQIRISTEVWGKWGPRWRYKRLRGCHVTVSCPSPRQAELTIDLVPQLLERLNGKWLLDGTADGTK